MYILLIRMTRRYKEPMRREFGPLISSKASKRLLQFTLHVDAGKLFCQTKEKCMVSQLVLENIIIRIKNVRGDGRKLSPGLAV